MRRCAGLPARAAGYPWVLVLWSTVFFTLWQPAGDLLSDDRLWVVDDAYFHLWAGGLPSTGTEPSTLRETLSLPDGALLSTSLPRGESAFAVSGNEAFFSSSAISQIWVLDAASGTVRRRVPGPDLLGAVALAATGSRLFAVTSSVDRGKTIHELDAETGRVVRQRHFAGGGDTIAVSRARDVLFVSSGRLEIRKLSLGNLVDIGFIPAPQSFRALAFDETNDRLLGVTEEGEIVTLHPETGAEESRRALVDGHGRARERE
ncbi:MAG: hypothetical protein AAF517_18960, partial [Planctomycetota bacterium]